MSTWREQYKVHPAADVFPMMSDEELLFLGEDIKANGVLDPITFDKDGLLLDGRNRLEAAERAGIGLRSWEKSTYLRDPVCYVISRNILRRHLTKQQQAELIVAAYKAPTVAKAITRKADKVGSKPRQVGEVSTDKGGRGNVDTVKAAAVETAKAYGIGKRTVERALAKANGKTIGPKRAPKPSDEAHQKAVLLAAWKTCLPSVRRWFCEEIIPDVVQRLGEDNLGAVPAFLDRRGGQ
jgi:hypothetical protein